MERITQKLKEEHSTIFFIQQPHGKSLLLKKLFFLKIFPFYFILDTSFKHGFHLALTRWYFFDVER